MEIKLENLKLNDWEINTTLSSEDIIGITGPEYEEVLEILSLKEIAEGQIIINEEIITKENQYEYYKKISLVQKDLKKINYLNTIKEHMDFIINYYHLQIKNIEKKEKDSLKIVGLDSSLLDRNITSLSKSEQKKVQIAISLLSNPEIMILDEPFKSLDNKSRKKIMMILTKLKEQYHKIIIIGSNNADILQHDRRPVQTHRELHKHGSRGMAALRRGKVAQAQIFFLPAPGLCVHNADVVRDRLCVLCVRNVGTLRQTGTRHERLSADDIYPWHIRLLCK